MRKLWYRISFLGLDGTDKSIDNRNLVLANQINFVIVVLLLLYSLVFAIIREVFDGEFTIHTQKLLYLTVFCLINMVLAYYGMHKLIKCILIFIPVLVMLLFPIFLGVVQELDMIILPLGAIAFSLVPQIILKPNLRNTIYLVSMGYFLIILIILDSLLVYFAPVKLSIVDAQQNFHIYYKTVASGVFLLLHIPIYYVRNENYKYEKEILEYNEELSSTIEELRITQQHLVQSEKMASLGTLISGVAHEINNPLNFISSGSYMMKDIKNEIQQQSNDEVKKSFDSALEMVDNGLDRTIRIVKSLMTFAYRGKPILVASNICDIIDNTLMFLKSKISDNIEIKKKYHALCVIDLYPDKIHQVIMNILDNALYELNRIEQSSKVIDISTNLEDGFLVLRIGNNGPKIPEKVIDKLYDPFFTTKDPGKGTGLGLSICYTLIEEHKGKLTAENTPDGVVFGIFLPVNSAVFKK